MRAHFIIQGFFLAIAIGSCAAPPPPASRGEFPIIPLPASVVAGQRSFALKTTTTIAVESADSAFMLVARMAAGLLSHATGFNLVATRSSGTPTRNAVVFRQTTVPASDEGYRLVSTDTLVIVESRTGAGAFYALQTLRQLLPPDAESASPTRGKAVVIPALAIEDAPRYSYRGMHLDVGRHFFPVEFVKRYIDLLAMHKMNRFHWHLTDDQGWRIEIKRYPRLTEVGSWRKETLIGHLSDLPHRFDGKRYGGFYTQEEVRDIVRYAQDRFVTIIPEIEMPGHSLAALAAYPELGCTGGPYEASTVWGIFEDVFCTKDSVFTFLEDVLTEVMDLFPGTLIHVGGDEVPKTRWKTCPQCIAVKARENLKNEHELQSYFINRVERFLNSRGRRLIGWDEILEGGLAPNATVMSWRGTQGGIDAARLRHDVVMSPGSHCYFDHYQSQATDEPLAIGGFTPLERVYAYEPTPAELTPEESRHILGAQGNVWTEYIATGLHAEYMAYPRAIALAEALWTPKDRRNFEGFVGRWVSHSRRLDALGVNCANHVLEVRHLIGPADDGITLSLSTFHRRSTIRFMSGTKDPTTESPRFTDPLHFTSDTTIRAAVFADKRRVSRVWGAWFTVHAAAGKPISLAFPPSPEYASGGRQALVNGLMANGERYSDPEWLGWSERDMEATIDLLESQRVNSVSLRFFNSHGSWIWLPKSVNVFASSDGESYTPAGSFSTFDYGSTNRTESVKVGLQNVRARYLRVVVRRYGLIPEGSPGAGRDAWLFSDEIVVR